VREPTAVADPPVEEKGAILLNWILPFVTPVPCFVSSVACVLADQALPEAARQIMRSVAHAWTWPMVCRKIDAMGLLSPNGTRKRMEKTEKSAADSITMAATLVYWDPWLGPSTDAMRRRKRSRRETIAIVTKILIANEIEKYGIVQFKFVLTNGDAAESWRRKRTPTTKDPKNKRHGMNITIHIATLHPLKIIIYRQMIKPSQSH